MRYNHIFQVIVAATCLVATLFSVVEATSTRQNGMDGGSRLRANARGSLMPGNTDIAVRDRVTTITDDHTEHFLFPNDPRFPGVFERSAPPIAPRLALTPLPPTPPVVAAQPGTYDFHLENSDLIGHFGGGLDRSARAPERGMLGSGTVGPGTVPVFRGVVGRGVRTRALAAGTMGTVVPHVMNEDSGV